LDRRSDALAWSFLEPLDDPKRERLISAVIEVDRLLRASMVTLAIEDPSTSDARWCIRQYFLELDVRFEQGFDPSQSIPADEGDLIMPTGALVIARLQGQPIGCGALKFHGSRPTELKRMWVTPEARGLGVGRRILMELERIARDAGSHVVRLETNHALTEAISLYRTSGYREVEAFNDEPYAHHWFQKQLRLRRHHRIPESRQPDQFGRTKHPVDS
jgi:GNAT superfamily N-acetyltransferase